MAIMGLFFVMVFLLPTIVSAQSNGQYGLNYAANVGLSTEDIRVAAVRIIRNILTVLGILAVIIILYGGFVWMTSQGDRQKIDLAKKIILNAAIGLIIIMMAFAIVQWIFSVLSSSQQAAGGELCQANQCYGCMRCQPDQTDYYFDANCDPQSCDNVLGDNAFSVNDFQTAHGDPSADHYAGDPDKSNVYWCSKVQAVFNRDPKSDSVSQAAADGSLHVALMADNSSVAGDWDVRGNVISFTPANHEFTQRSADHSERLPTTLTDKNDLALSNCSLSAACESSPPPDFGWNFYVGEEGDDQAPYITQTYPQSSDPDHPDNNVPRDPIIDVSFSENVDAATVTDVDGIHPYPGHIYLYELDKQGAVVGQVDNGLLLVELKDKGFRLHLDPPNLLKAFTTYQVVVRDIQDLCGNVMDPNPYQWNFTTTDQAPGISGYYPTGDNVCPDTKISLTFNTSMYYSQVTFTIQPGDGSGPSSYVLSPSTGLLSTDHNSGSGQIGGTFHVVDQDSSQISTHYRVYEFVPARALDDNITYHISYTTDKVIDAQGNTLGQSWQFSTTDAEHCVCSPYISYLSKEQGPTGDCLTINGYCFTGTQNQPAAIAHIYFNQTDALIGEGYSDSAVGTTVPQGFNEGDRPGVSLTINYENGSSVPPSNSRQFLITQGQANGPCLWSINPDHGRPGSTQVTLTGLRFGNFTQNSVHQVVFNDHQIVDITQADNWTDTKIVNVTVPQNAVDGQVIVNNSQGSSNGLPFDVQFCGDNTVDPGEDCDGTNLNGQTCLDLGWLGGTLSCTSDCRFNTSQCSNAPQVIERNECKFTCDGGDNAGKDCSSDSDCPGGSCLSETTPSPNPYKNKEDVCLNSSISAVFNTDIDQTTFNTHNVYLQRCADALCGGNLSPVNAEISSTASRSFVLTPTAALQPDSWYQVTLTTGITSLAGVHMQNNYIWRFKTKSGTALCPLQNVDVKPDEQTAGANQSLSYYAVALGPDCTFLQGADSYNWQWSVDEPSLNTAVTQSLEHSSQATVVTGDQKGTVNIRASAEGKYDNRGTLHINFENCASDNDCSDPNGDGVAECAGSVCDLAAGGYCTPLIQSLDPASGPQGRWVTLHGCHFKSERGDGRIEFQNQTLGTYTVDNYPCNNKWDDNQIIISVPSSISASGPYNVQLFDKYGLASNRDSVFNVTDSCTQDGVPVPAGGVPGLCQLNPDNGVPGNDVSLIGENFSNGGADGDKVEFNGVEANINQWSGQTIQVKAPSSSSGPVMAYVQNCPSNSLDFSYQSGNVGDNCNGGGADECVAQDNLCWPGLYCATDSCTCQTAPLANVIDSSRFPYPRLECRNGVIGATFDTLMKSGTLNSDTVKLWHKIIGNRPSGDCVSAGVNDNYGGGGQQINYLSQPHKKLSALVNLFKYLLKKIFSPAQAQLSTVWWCPVSGSVAVQNVAQGVDSCNNAAGCTKFIFTPSSPLTASGSVDTFELNILGGDEGVKSKYGAELNTNSTQRPYSDQPSYYWDFSLYSNTKICQIDHVRVDITSRADGEEKVINNALYDYYTCAGRDDCEDDVSAAMSGNQHRYFAQAYDAQDVALAAAYQWSEHDTDNLIELQNPSDQQTNYVTANAFNGHSLVRVSALDPNPDDTIEYGSAQQAVNVTNFLCQNPWPSLTDFPFEDRGGNCEMGGGSCLDMTFSTYYCRDAGHDKDFCLGGSNDGQLCQSDQDCPGGRCADYTEDDLPAPADGDPLIKSSQSGYCVGGSQHGQLCNNDSDCGEGYCYNVLKEYMFTFQQGRCAQHGTVCSNDTDCPGEDSCVQLNDLVGIRVYNNGEHLSPAAWYQKYANQPGSYSTGQTYDDYQSIVSGRTTYINAAVDTQPNGAHNIYTDMFLFSHTADANQATLNIYQQFLDNLKFNINGISDLRVCSQSGQYCEKDSDCLNGETCDAAKTKLARDTIRMGHLSEMIYHLDLYRGYCSRHQNLACLEDSSCPDSGQADNPETCIIKNQTYPLLESGTYLAGQSVSVWDSWHNTFAQLLGTSPLLDPLNEVFCDKDAGYNSECWNEDTKNFQCGSGSHMYHYRVNADGSGYSLFTNMEYSNSGWQPANDNFNPQPSQDICSPGAYNLEYIQP